MRRAIVVVVLALAMLVSFYFYGSPEYRRLKKECAETSATSMRNFAVMHSLLPQERANVRLQP
jgi:hypothetical protein